MREEKSTSGATPVAEIAAATAAGAYYTPPAVLQLLGEIVANGTKDDIAGYRAADPVLGNPPFGVSP
jgi:hypothetical protein